MKLLLLSLLTIPNPSLFSRVSAVHREVVTVDRAGHEYRYTPLDEFEDSLFVRVNAAYSMREEELTTMPSITDPILDRQGHASTFHDYGCSDPLYCEELTGIPSRLPWDTTQDQGCGYRNNPLDASEIADWTECQVAGIL